MNKQLAFIPITGLVLLTVAGCATVPNGNGANNNQVTNSTTSTSDPNTASNPTGSTRNIASNTGSAANIVQVSWDSMTTSQPNDANEIALIKSKGYSVSGTTPSATVKTSSGATLSAWMGVSGNDGHNQLVFFFLNGTYLGTDTAKPSVEITSIRSVGNGIAVTYPVYKKNDSFADPTGTPVTITYTWNGSTLVPNKPYPEQFQASTTQGNNPISTKSYSTSTEAASYIASLEAAQSAFSGNAPTLNLGNGITAKVDAGMGHAGYQWHEGNWTMEILFYTENRGVKQVAENMVSYLHTHMLPAPNTHGAIVVRSANANTTSFKPTTTIAWQEGNKVYQLKKSGNPVQALATAVNQNTAPKTSSSQAKFHQTFKNSGASHQVFLTSGIGFQVTNLGGGASNFEYQFSKTTDGGKTWTKLSTGHYSDVEGVSFVDDQTGYLLNNSPAYAITPDLFVTHNGGVTWTEQKLPIPSAYSNAYRSSNYPIFFSPTVGFIPVYGEPTQQSTTRKFLYMLVTTNGGKSWTAYTNAQGDGLSWNVNGQKLTVTKGPQTITVNGLLGIWNVSTGN